MSGPVARAFLVVRLAPASGDDDAPSVAPIRACVSATYGADGGDGTDEDRELVATVRAKNFAIPEYPSEAICAPVKDDASIRPADVHVLAHGGRREQDHRVLPPHRAPAS